MEDKATGEKEIDVLESLNKVWLKRTFVLKIIAGSAILGLIIAFSIPKDYTTTVILMPESQSSSASSMSSLAALAGLNLNTVPGMDALALPDLYPDILKSTPFLKGLLNIKVKDQTEGIDTELYSYMSDYQKSSWWSYIVKAPSLLKKLFSSSDGDSIQPNSRVITEDEMIIIENLQERLSVSSDKKTGVTTISVTMQSPEISAFLADTLTSYLQMYIIDYRTQKARNDLEYAEKLYDESKINYYKAQKDLAEYIDGNINVVSARYRTTQERLQNEANLTYSLYNQMAQQLQMTKVRVQDTTPFFTVIQPAVQPLFPSKPSKKLILIGVVFLAFIGASTWVIREDIWSLLTNKKNE